VQENLDIGAFVPRAKAERALTMEFVHGIFLRLAERRKQLAGTMSGGEQQMLAVGRGSMLKPRLLMLDEPSLGLAPVITDVTFEKIAEIHYQCLFGTPACKACGFRVGASICWHVF
jgi:branched-chain amino acid transport system ATP-binding protein